MSVAYHWRFRQNMINLPGGSQSASYDFTAAPLWRCVTNVCDFSFRPAILISFAAGQPCIAPFGRQSKRRINRDLITGLGGYLLQWSEGAPTVVKVGGGAWGCRSVIRFPLMALHASLGLAKSEVRATLRRVWLNRKLQPASPDRLHGRAKSNVRITKDRELWRK